MLITTRLARRLLVGALSVIVLACGSSGDATDTQPPATTTATSASPTTGASVSTSAPVASEPGTSAPPSVATTVPSEQAPESTPVLPVTLTDDSGAEVTITDVTRIIPANGDLVEVVWALGLGDNVVATDISATYPAAAENTPKIGYQRALVAETILAHEPTIVLADELAGPVEVLDQLRTTHIPVVIVNRNRSVDGPIDKVLAVAEALGVPGRGHALAATMRAEIDDALAESAAAVAVSGRPRVLALYLRGTTVQLSFGKGSGVDVLIDAAGGLDVGTEAGIVDTQQLSTEAIVAAQPEILLVSTSGLESVGGIDGLLAIPGFDQTPAATTRAVVTFETQYLYGFGPRTGQLLSELVAAFHP